MTPLLTKDELSIIRIIFMTGQCTRSEIASRLEMSLIKVSSILESLEKNRFITKEERKIRRGRPSFLYKIISNRFYSIGISFFIDKFRLCVTNTDKEVIFNEEFPVSEKETDEDQIKFVVNTLEDLIKYAINSQAVRNMTPISAGISLPGMVDSDNGIWLLGLHVPGVANKPLSQILEDRTKLPVFIEDASRTHAFFEKAVGEGKSLKNFILFFIDRGIGAGIVINNELYHGAGGLSGEIGHVIHRNNKYRCVCGSIGCFETVISSVGIIRVFKDRLNECCLNA